MDAEEYVCQACEEKFFYLPPGHLICPKCGGDDPEFLLRLEAMEEEDER